MGETMEWLTNTSSLFPAIGISSVVDILLVTLMIYAFLIVVKRTQRSAPIFTGILIVGVIYLAARRFGLTLTTALLQGFFTVILIALVVIFQEDLRHFFERVGLWWRERRLPSSKRQSRRLPRREVEVLARTLGDFARARIGALVVVRGRDTIARHLDGGEMVQGRLSEPLLKSIFDPHSIGHDGAVIIEGGLIECLGAHLPLSKNLEKLRRSGTRHAAALGLAERTDALCLVVSEERGVISIARRGDLWTLSDASELAQVIELFYDETMPRAPKRFWTDLIRRDFREKAAALGLAVALWWVVGVRSEVVQRTFAIPVQCGLPPSGFMIARRIPETINITLSGPRREFDFLSTNELKLVIGLGETARGRQRVRISSRDLSFPGKLDLEDIEPREVFIEIQAKPPETSKPQP